MSTFLKVIAYDLVIGLAFTALIALFVMLGIGNIHALWLHDVPTIAYGSAFLVVLPFEVAIAAKRLEQRMADAIVDGAL